jgi:hypothetical protein
MVSKSNIAGRGLGEKPQRRKDAKTHNLGLDPLGISLRLCASAVQCIGSHSSRSASMGRIDAAFRDGIKVEHRREGFGGETAKTQRHITSGWIHLEFLCASAPLRFNALVLIRREVLQWTCSCRFSRWYQSRTSPGGVWGRNRKDAKTHNLGLDPLGISLRLCASAVQCIGSHSSRSASMGRIAAVFREGIKVEHRREGFGGETAKTQRHITSGWIHLEFLCASAPLRFNALVLIRREVLQ